MQRWLILMLAVCSVVWAQVESPRLAELERELSGEALEAFWVEMDTRGGPLIEEWDETHSRVTFVYRGNGTEDRVVLFSGVRQRDPEDCLMQRLGGTDLWYRTEIVENDVRTTYRFSVNGTLMPYSKVSLEEFFAEMREEVGRWRTDPFNSEGSALYSVLEMPDSIFRPAS